MLDNEHRESEEVIGRHIIADFWDCDYKDDARWLLEIIINAAHISHAKIIDSVFHQFEPTGSTALLLLAESHMSIHTWPEYRYVAVDIFTCGIHMDPELAVKYLEDTLKPKRKEIKVIKRGQDKNE